MWQAWTNGIIGLWLFIAAFLNFSSSGNMWDDLIVGVITAVVGFSMAKVKPWQGWLTGLVGLWLLISLFVPSLLNGLGNEWNAIISGILLMVGGFGAIGSHPYTDHSVHSH